MRLRLVALLGLGMSLSGCTCTIDPESVKPPVACLATGCAGKACGYVDCGHVCARPADACVETHRMTEGSFGTFGATNPAAGTHTAAGGLAPGAEAAPAAAGGHKVSQGKLSN